MAEPTTQRIRMNEHCVWPERVGCEGVVVRPSAYEATRYPFHGRGKNEVIVHLDNDPLRRPIAESLGWSCVTDRKALDFLGGEHD